MGSLAFAADENKDLNDSIADLNNILGDLGGATADLDGALNNLNLVLEGGAAMTELVLTMNSEEAQKHTIYLDAMTNEDDKNALLTAFAKEKKGDSMTNDEKKQMAAYRKAVFGSETGKPSGTGKYGLADMKDFMEG